MGRWTKSERRYRAPATGLFERGAAAYERKEYVSALNNWRQAYALGHVEAAYRIGQLYTRGEGVMYSLPDAAIWYRQAADAGHADAQFHLGLIHMHGYEAHPGVGGPRHWLDFASRRDDQLARSTLDALFPHGIRVEPDLDEALRWLHAAAQGGKAEAQVLLGEIARWGRGWH